jgi:hypothetical protein
MPNYTTTQMQLLASACERADGIATRPASLNRTAAVKVAAKLLDQGLVQEVPAKRTWPVWRTDDHGKPISLKILKPGRAVAKAAAKDTIAPTAAPAISGDGMSAPATRIVADPPAPAQVKAGSKRNLILSLMRRESGATITDLTTATGWLPHTTRAALTGLRKSGVAIARSQDAEKRLSVYRIAAPAAA